MWLHVPACNQQPSTAIGSDQKPSEGIGLHRNLSTAIGSRAQAMRSHPKQSRCDLGAISVRSRCELALVIRRLKLARDGQSEVGDLELIRLREQQVLAPALKSNQKQSEAIRSNQKVLAPARAGGDRVALAAGRAGGAGRWMFGGRSVTGHCTWEGAGAVRERWGAGAVCVREGAGVV